jgi:hypothetical protein
VERSMDCLASPTVAPGMLSVNLPHHTTSSAAYERDTSHKHVEQ